MKILVLELNYLGDLMMSSPAVKALSQIGEVDVLAYDFAKELLANHSHITHVYTCSKSKQQVIKTAWELRSEGYDVGIQFNTSLFNNVALLLAGCRERIGYNHNHRAFLNTVKVPIAQSACTVGRRTDEVCDLVEKSFHVPVWDRQMVYNVEGEWKEKGFITVIHTCTRNTSWLRQWHGWRELVLRIGHKFGWRIYYTGSKADAEYVRGETRYCPAINLCGKTTIDELARLLKRADLCVTVNTFTMHLAIALETPTVAIVGGTDVSVVCPSEDDKFKHVQSGLTTKEITVDMVWDKIIELKEGK